MLTTIDNERLIHKLAEDVAYNRFYKLRFLH